MFLRLKNVLDYEIAKADIDSMIDNESVSFRIKEILSVLDEAYGANRLSKEMGGYVFLFSDEDTYNANIDKALEGNGFGTDIYEYSDVIGSNQDRIWKEELYLVSSEDSITVIHPIDGSDIIE